MSRSLKRVSGSSHVADSLDNIVILAELLEQTDLPDRCTGHAFVFRLESNLLQSDKVARREVSGLVHDTVCALSDLLQLGIVFQRHGLMVFRASTGSESCWV